MKLSVVIITQDEERNLARTLASVAKIADEIIILDSGSTDKTAEIAKDFGAKFSYQKWLGYGLQKNKAISLASGDLILNIDADEVVSEELAKKIEEIKKDSQFKVYKIDFTSVFFGKKLKYGEWGNDSKIRLFLKGAGSYNDNEVHEDFITEEKIGRIKEKIYHYSYVNSEDYFNKFNRYTSEAANQAYKQGKKAKIYHLTLSPLYKFIKSYIFRLGFLDGYEGFFLSIFAGFYTFVKYFKLKDKHRN